MIDAVPVHPVIRCCIYQKRTGLFPVMVLQIPHPDSCVNTRNRLFGIYNRTLL